MLLRRAGLTASAGLSCLVLCSIGRTAMHAMPFSNMLTFSSIDEFLSHVRMRDNGTAVLSVFLYVALR